MLHQSGRKICSFFAHYFLFYAIVVACFCFSSCFCSGVRRELIPERNEFVSKLSEESKEDLLALRQRLDDSENKELEKKIKTIKHPDHLKDVVNSYNAYKDILKFLPKPERPAFQQKFTAAIHSDTQENLIDQYSNGFQVIKNASMQTQQIYTDLLETLPDDKAIALKNKVAQSTSPSEVGQIIASWLPMSFKQLDDERKEAFSTLSDPERQKILKAAMQQNDKKDGLGSQADKKKPNDDHSTLPDVHELIAQKVQEQATKVENNIPEDGWGTKLPLVGQQRDDFLKLTLEFDMESQKSLKALFDETCSESIQNFLSVFFTGFTKEQRIELLFTIIYLYKGWPDLTIQLCNNPQSLTLFQRVKLFRRTNTKQLELLQKLDNLLSE